MQVFSYKKLGLRANSSDLENLLGKFLFVSEFFTQYYVTLSMVFFALITNILSLLN